MPGSHGAYLSRPRELAERLEPAQSLGSATEPQRRPYGTTGRAFRDHGEGRAALQSYYAELFDWDIDANNEFGYGIVTREANTNRTASASAAASPPGRRATTAT